MVDLGCYVVGGPGTKGRLGFSGTIRDSKVLVGTPHYYLVDDLRNSF